MDQKEAIRQLVSGIMGGDKGNLFTQVVIKNQCLMEGFDSAIFLHGLLGSFLVKILYSKDKEITTKARLVQLIYSQSISK